MPDPSNWCCYKNCDACDTVQCDPPPNDCHLSGSCSSGTCSAPQPMPDGSLCNSQFWGKCASGVCVEQPPPATKPSPSPSPLPSPSPSPSPSGSPVPSPPSSPSPSLEDELSVESGRRSNENNGETRFFDVLLTTSPVSLICIGAVFGIMVGGAALLLWQLARVQAPTHLQGASGKCVTHDLELVAQDGASQKSKHKATVSVVNMMGNPLWKEAIDTNTGKHYYYNTETGESSWTRPVGIV